MGINKYNSEGYPDTPYGQAVAVQISVLPPVL